MRKLVLAAFVLYLGSWWALRDNAGPWVAILVFLAASGALQAPRYPALPRETFVRMRNLVPKRCNSVR
jgi:hypothetical protein